MSNEHQERDNTNVDSTKGSQRNLATDIARIAAQGAKRARDLALVAQNEDHRKKKQELLNNPQLLLWAEAVRGAPNDFVRSALFTARNRKIPRENLKQALLATVGEGEITYTGEELRQDDENVWLQLIHLARENGLAKTFEFTPYSFCKAINWPISGQSFDRLDKCMTRLQATSLKMMSKRLNSLVAFSMLPHFKANRRKDGDGGLWTVQLHDELVFLFSEFQYTRLEWQQRLALPEGLTTWLHAYYASHKKPFPVKFTTLAIGAGLLTVQDAEPASTDPDVVAKHRAQLREIKKLIVKALDTLQDTAFLDRYAIGRTGLVTVHRA